MVSIGSLTSSSRPTRFLVYRSTAFVGARVRRHHPVDIWSCTLRVGCGLSGCCSEAEFHLPMANKSVSNAQDAPYTLYHHPYSICSLMVRYTLAVKGAPHSPAEMMVVKEQEVDIFKGAQLDEHFLLEINPQGQVSTPVQVSADTLSRYLPNASNAGCHRSLSTSGARLGQRRSPPNSYRRESRDHHLHSRSISESDAHGSQGRDWPLTA